MQNILINNSVNLQVILSGKKKRKVNTNIENERNFVDIFLIISLQPAVIIMSRKFEIFLKRKTCNCSQACWLLENIYFIGVKIHF